MNESEHQRKAKASFGRRLLSVREAAELLGIGTTSFYELLGRGDLPSVRLGGRRLIDPVDLDAFIAAHREEVFEK